MITNVSAIDATVLVWLPQVPRLRSTQNARFTLTRLFPQQSHNSRSVLRVAYQENPMHQHGRQRHCASNAIENDESCPHILLLCCELVIRASTSCSFRVNGRDGTLA
eukprot:2388919-Amphidinium_carterae.1